MKKIYLLILSLFVVQNVSAQDYSDKITLVIHGGAGTITRANMTSEKEKAYRQALDAAL